MASARRGEVRVHIDAPPGRVWSLLAYPERMGEWSPECYRVQWLNGATSPATPGTRFKGFNKFGLIRWSMTCEVKTVEPGRALVFSTFRGQRECVRWRYQLAPANGGTDVIESFEVIWMPLDARIFEDFLMRDRDRRRKQAMRTTLERIGAAAQSGLASTPDPDS